MLKKANISWSVKQYTKMMEKGTITFDNVIQRTLVWDDDRKSLLIHSALYGYPIPKMYSVKKDKKYDMLDGKQRSRAFYDYLNNVFPLTDVPEVSIEGDNGEESIDITGKFFKELPEDLQETINSTMLSIEYYDEEITEEEIEELFFRLNNGKPLTNIELTRVRAKSKEQIHRLSQNALFNKALTEKALKRYTNEDIVIKSYIVLFVEEKSLENLRPLMERAIITDEQVDEMEKIFERIINIHELMKDNKKIAKRILVRTHLISIVPIIGRSLKENRTEEEMRKWIEKFFSGGKASTISERYNENAKRSTARKSSVIARLEEIEKSYEEFFGFDKEVVEANNENNDDNED